jgi:hypothetical protein
MRLRYRLELERQVQLKGPPHNHRKSASNQDFQIRISRSACCNPNFETFEQRVLSSY